jgi:hypothetical protein
LTGHEAGARALQHYLALPSSAQLKTIAALKAYDARLSGGPCVLESIAIELAELDFQYGRLDCSAQALVINRARQPARKAQ